MKYDSHGGRGATDNYHGLGWQAKYGDDGFGAAGKYPKGYAPKMYPTPMTGGMESGGEYVSDPSVRSLKGEGLRKVRRVAIDTEEEPLPIRTDGVTANSPGVRRNALVELPELKQAQEACWSTPTKTQPKMPTATLRARAQDPIHKGHTSVPLIEQLQRVALEEYERRTLPTPMGSVNGSGKANGLRGGKGSEHEPGKWQSKGHPEYGELNPDWVEWIMGWCLGWSSPQPIAPHAVSNWLQQTLSDGSGAPGEWWRGDPSDDPAAGVPKTVPASDKPGELLREGRIAALGNGQVPAVVAAVWTHLWNLEVPEGEGE